MKSKKGFTLVELLAVVVILGIITGISIPLIRNIQEQNTTRKFKTYQDSLKVSAKLYVDSYAEDLFGNEKSGCAVIRYDQLEDKSMIKDISVDKESCNSNLTCVRVVKMDDKYTYYPMIGCGNMGVDGKVSSVTVKLPEAANCQIDACGVNNYTIVTFIGDPEKSSTINYKRKNLVVKMSSYTGFHEDMDIDYSFVNSVGAPQNNRDNPTIVGEWQKLKVNYIGGNEQKRKIEKGNIVTLTSDQITTPAGITGEYYVVLKINKLMNLTGRSWTTDTNRGVYAYVGPYKVYNTSPVFANTSTVESSTSGYNSVTPKLKINVTDNYSTASDLRMCTSYDSDTCSKTISDIKNKANGWITYNTTKTLSKIQNNQDGSTHTVYVSVGDAAGNYTTKSYSYTITPEYTITYNGNGHTSGRTASTTCISGVSCTLATNGFAKTGYNYAGWYTAASGGTKYGTTTTITGNTTIYAHWVDDIKPTCTTSKSNLGTPDGVTVTISCSDAGSGCSSSNTLSYTGVKSNATYTVSDNDGNTGTCSVTIGTTTQYRYHTRTEARCTSSCCGTHDCHCSSCHSGENTCSYGCNTCTGTRTERQCTYLDDLSGGGGRYDCRNVTVSYNYSCNCSSCHSGHNTCSYGCDKCNDTCTSASCCGYNAWGNWSGWGGTENNCSTATCQSETRYLYS